MKKYDSVTVIGVIVCLASFVLMMLYLPKPKPQASKLPPPPPETVQKTTPATPEGTAAQPGAQASDGQAQPVPAVTTTYSPTAPLPESLAPLEIVGKHGDSVFQLRQDIGGIDSITLLKHALYKKRQAGEQEIPRVVMGHYDYPFLNLNSGLSGVEILPGQATVSEDGQRVTLERQSADGKLSFQETWDFASPDDDYGIAYGLTVRNLTAETQNLAGLRLEVGALPPSLDGSKKSRGEGAGGLDYGLLKGDAKHLNLKDVSDKMDDKRVKELASTSVNWIGIHSKYFLFCLQAGWEGGFIGLEGNACPVTSEAPLGADPQTPAVLRYHARAILPALAIPANGETKFSVQGYAGPKNFERLHKLGDGVETVMEMDRFFFGRARWMGWLSRLLLWGMSGIARLFPASIAHGMGIICLTLFVKLIFWPLSHRSQVSMRKMQALQPQLKELREKYKGDPQKMYAKQQELFKANNVSQMGGCLPMLLQIPVFFALFNTFRNAIELRHAGFLWAMDLSMPDDLFFTLFGLPIRPFALLMGASMYWQQKLTPSPDPNQARMMNIMSLVFIFMFYSLPSALTLYMTVNQLLSIAQMLITRKFENPDQNQLVIPASN
jgi:YidC/Oxa1 family membrane protein insertase